MPMECDTECVNMKSKVVVPSAGLSIPSIFCSTSGPTSVVELLDDDHGQPKSMCGRGTLAPKECSVADSAASTAQATARWKPATMTTITVVQRSQRGNREYQCRLGGRG